MPDTSQIGPYWKYATFTHQLLQNTKQSLDLCEKRAKAYKFTETQQRKIAALRCQIAVLNKSVAAMRSAEPRCVTSICKTFFEKNILRMTEEINKKNSELQKLTVGSPESIERSEEF